MRKRILTTALSVLLITSLAFAQEIYRARINRFEGGMNSNYNADTLEENQGASMYNVSLKRQGKLDKRTGQNLFNRDVGNTAWKGIGRFDPDKTTSYLLAASGVDIIYSLSTDTAWRRANAASPLTSGQSTEFVQANKNLFIMNGFDRTVWFDGARWAQSSGWAAGSPPVATTAAWLRNYLFMAGEPTNTDWIYFSTNLEPTKFVYDKIVRINTGDGQAIQRLMAYRLNELIVYKERSIFVLDITGNTSQTPPEGWITQPISTVIGTIAPKSVVSLGNDQWFLSSEPIAIRSLNRTEFDKILVNRLSDPIQDIFDGTGPLAINKTHISKAAAVLYDDKYILAIPTGTSTENNTVVVYDFYSEAWYIITGWYPAEWQKFDNRLFYIDAYDGRMLECFASGTSGDFRKGPMVTAGASIPSVGPEYYYISRDLDFDSPEQFKMPDALEVVFDPTGNYNATIMINMDNTGWQEVGTINLSGDGLTLPFTLPGKLFNSGVSRKTFQIQQYGEFKKAKVLVKHTASSETVSLTRVTLFGRIKPWRRE